MALVSELITVLKVQDANFQQGIAKAQAQLNSMAKSATSSFSLIKSAIAAVGVYALVNSLKDATHQVSELADASEKLNVSVESLQRLRFAAQQVGVSSESVTQAIGRMTRMLGQAATNGEEAAIPFTQLGLSIQSLMQLNPDEQFVAIADAIKQIKDPTLQAKAAADILGRGFIQNMGFLRSDIAGNIALFKSLGAELSTNQVNAVDKLGDKYGELSAQWDGFKGQLLEALHGPLIDFAKWIQQSIKDAGGLNNIVRQTANTIIAGFGAAGEVIYKIRKSLSLLAIGFLEVDKAFIKLHTTITLGANKLFYNPDQQIARLQTSINSLSSSYLNVTDKAQQFDRTVQKMKQALASSPNTLPISTKSLVNDGLVSEIKLQKDITQEYKTQLETIKQAVKAQQAKIQAITDERQLLDDLVTGRGGENERFKELGEQASKIKQALQDIKNSGPELAGPGPRTRLGATFDTSAIEEGLRKFEEQRSSISADSFISSRLNELQRAVSILNDPAQRFGAGGLERDTKVELKVLVQAQEGLEAKIAQSKANKKVILQTINEEFDAAAGGIQ